MSVPFPPDVKPEWPKPPVSLQDVEIRMQTAAARFIAATELIKAGAKMHERWSCPNESSDLPFHDAGDLLLQLADEALLKATEEQRQIYLDLQYRGLLRPPMATVTPPTET